MYMKRISSFIFAIAVFAALTVSLTAKADVPQVQVKVILSSVSGDSVVLTRDNTSADGELTAPLTATFMASLVTDDGKDYVLFPQWTVKRYYRDGDTEEEENYLKRQEAVTGYEFTDDGRFEIKFAWSYREKDSVETILGAEVPTMSFVIDDSELTLYNAFSPNGDGINDEFKIYTKSIVSIKIAIFNRWGQTIKTISGKMDEVLPFDAEPDENGGYKFEIWDGRFNGSIVNDGVYFMNVQATGAGGKKYDRRVDINVLTGLGAQQ